MPLRDFKGPDQIEEVLTLWRTRKNLKAVVDSTVGVLVIFRHG
jgi:hypothetical protein